MKVNNLGKDTSCKYSKKAGMAILILYKVDLRVKKISRDRKEYYILIKIGQYTKKI